ncbi:hypothetical protein [Microbacterium sp. KR10-403]|uniref:hypothetical protein n=1 Tax=Microbacterium sp. KR10-403 TaxID=3158581 RepID=UPI0032E3F3AA
MMETLIPVYTVHCFFGRCRFTVQDTDTHEASRRMQWHYDEEHVDDLTRLGYPPAKGAR